MHAHSRLATPCQKADLLLSQPMTSDLGSSRVDQGWTSLAFVQRQGHIDRLCENRARRSRPLSGLFCSCRFANIQSNLVEAQAGSPASELPTADPSLHPLTDPSQLRLRLSLLSSLGRCRHYTRQRISISPSTAGILCACVTLTAMVLENPA